MNTRLYHDGVGLNQAMVQGMISKKLALGPDPRVGTGFRKRSCSNKKLERCGDSTKNHSALARKTRERRERLVDIGGGVVGADRSEERRVGKECRL